MKCEALDWQKDEKDYLECSSEDSVRRFRLEGIMLAVEANLCSRHYNYFNSQPSGWRSVIVTRAKAKPEGATMPAVVSEVTFTVMQIPPSRNHYVGISRRGGYKTKKALAFEKEIWAVGRQVRQRSDMPKLTKCRIEISLYFWTGANGQEVDIDNAPKLILDGLRNCGFYDDDKAVREMEVLLHESAGTPRTEITVRARRERGKSGDLYTGGGEWLTK